MNDPEEARVPPGTGSLADGFRESVPLILISFACFAAGIYANDEDITVGAGHYPIAGVLIILAFISAIGAVLSWFFAGSARDAALLASRRYRSPRPPPWREPEEWVGGHPRPSVRIDSTARARIPYTSREPWDEGPAEAPPRPRQVRPRPGPAARETLQELEGIQEELLAHRDGERPTTVTVRPRRPPLEPESPEP